MIAQNEQITCGFCGATTTRDAAPADGWLPGYWYGQQEIDLPVCFRCAAQHVRKAADGEYELIEADQAAVVG